MHCERFSGILAPNAELTNRGSIAMSDHAEEFDHGKVFIVMIVIANLVLWPALYGLVRGVLN
jgi:hypothetical protein